MRFRRPFIHAFVLFHLAAVVGWAFTPATPRTKFERVVRNRFAFYMLPLGLWQSWDMFAPNPAMANVYLEAEVTLRDGSRTTWRFPRMEQLGYGQRVRKERYRKWAHERVATAGEGPVDTMLCDAAARFAARHVGRPENPPVTVELVRYRAEIPSPSRQQLRRPSAPEWERETIHTCRLDAPATGPSTAATGPSTAPASDLPEGPVP